MTRDDLEPLDPEIAELLDAEKRRPPLSAPAQQRILGRLQGSLAQAPPLPRPRRGWLPLATFVLGVITGVATWGLARPPAASRILMPFEPSVPSEPRGSSLVIAKLAVAPAPRAELPDHDLDLARERALLEIARAASGRGDSQATLAALQQHAHRFPHGRLSEERESLWVRALVQAGRFAEARERAARFRKSFPTSLLAPSVEAALRSIP